MGYNYLGEASGGRILRYGVGTTQIGDAYQLEVRAWDVRPMGPAGRCVFRKVHGLIRHTAGYDVEITPVLDGRPLTAQRFSGGPPSADLLEEIVPIEAPVLSPGNRLDVIVASVSLPGELEFIDFEASYTPLRESK